MLLSAIQAQHVLIVGGNGTIGSALKKRLVAEGYQVTSTTRRPVVDADTSLYLDLQDPASFSCLFPNRFDVAVLCGAITSLQTCEQNPDFSKLVNVSNTLILANMLADSGSHLIFLSSNLVFDGSKPLVQKSETKNPITEYGRQKSETEDGLLSLNLNSAIIRFGKILPTNFPLFHEWILSLSSGKHIYPYVNRTLAPIALPLAIDILVWLIAKKSRGVFQATAQYEMTYADVAVEVARLTQNDDSLIMPTYASSIYIPDGSSAWNSFYSTLHFSPEFFPFFTAPTPSIALSYSVLH